MSYSGAFHPFYTIMSPELWWYVSYPTQSSEFRCLERDWSVQFNICGPSWYLHLTCSRSVPTLVDFSNYHGSTAVRLGSETSSLASKKFIVDVRLQSEVSGLVLPTLSQTTRVSRDFSNGATIWQRCPEELLRASPEFQPKIDAFSPTGSGQLINGLRFVIGIKLEDPVDTLRRLNAPAMAPRPTDVRPSLLGLSEDFSRLLEQGSNPDVEFQCTGQSIGAHAVIVSARSPVIASMLASDMIEGKTRVVKVPDMEPDVFRKFLRYLYAGRLDGLTFEVALRLYEAGDQYAVGGLAKRCSEYLMEHLSVQNACEVLVIADAHSDADFVERVVSYMVCERVHLASEVWPAFCHEHPGLAANVLNRGWSNLLK